MIEVIHPGVFTTIQDCGRNGYQRFGVSVTGAMDSFSFELANRLVGNDTTTGAFEITFSGAKFFFHETAWIAVTGGDLGVQIDGVNVQRGRPIFIKEGTMLTFTAVKSGCRAYLSIAGGFAIPKVLTSESTFLRAQMGGWQGRALKKGDCLFFQQKATYEHPVKWTLPTDYIWNKEVVRIVKGPEWNHFTSKSQNQFLDKLYEISSASDRMGYRLNGPQLERFEQTEMLSEAVTFGTIQVPSDGKPIVLMADRQTTGGYPRIGQVVYVDLPVLAQKKPGDSVHFQLISMEAARKLVTNRLQWMRELKGTIKLHQPKEFIHENN